MGDGPNIVHGNFGGRGPTPGVRPANSYEGRVNLARGDIVPAFLSYCIQGIGSQDFESHRFDRRKAVLLGCAQNLFGTGEKVVSALVPVLHFLSFKEADVALSKEEVLRALNTSDRSRRFLAKCEHINLALSRKANMQNCEGIARDAIKSGRHHAILEKDKAAALFNTAVRQASIALALCPEEDASYLTLGSALAEMRGEENSGLATCCFQAVLDRAPGSPEAYTGLAYISHRKAWQQGEEEGFTRVIEIAREAETKGALGPLLRTMRFISLLTLEGRIYRSGLAEANREGSREKMPLIAKRFREALESAGRDIEPIVVACHGQRSQFFIRRGLQELLTVFLDPAEAGKHDGRAKNDFLQAAVSDPENLDRLALLFFVGRG